MEQRRGIIAPQGMANSSGSLVGQAATCPRTRLFVGVEVKQTNPSRFLLLDRQAKQTDELNCDEREDRANLPNAVRQQWRLTDTSTRDVSFPLSCDRSREKVRAWRDGV